MARRGGRYRQKKNTHKRVISTYHYGARLLLRCTVAVWMDMRSYLNNFEEKFSGHRRADRWSPGCQLHAEYLRQQLRVRVSVEMPSGRQLNKPNKGQEAT